MKIDRALGAKLMSVALAVTLVLGGCATEDEPEAEDTPDTATPEAQAVQVTAANYRYGNLPGELEAGTTLGLTNQSSDEVHEMVIFRLPDEETRSAAELVALPQEEVEAALGGPPTTVLVALPNSDGVVVVGDGTLSEPGRYLFACMIPVGADPDVYEQAMQNPQDGPPEIENAGPPHIAEGMFAEVNVT